MRRVSREPRCSRVETISFVRSPAIPARNGTETRRNPGSPVSPLLRHACHFVAALRRERGPGSARAAAVHPYRSGPLPPPRGSWCRRHPDPLPPPPPNAPSAALVSALLGGGIRAAYRAPHVRGSAPRVGRRGGGRPVRPGER